MRTGKNNSATAGVTLIELLVAVTLVAVILAAVNYLFAGATRMYDQGRVRIEMSMEARAIFDFLQRNLQGAVAVDSDDNGIPDSYFNGQATKLSFVGPVDLPAGEGLERGLDVAEIRFRYVEPVGAQPGQLYFQRDTDGTKNYDGGFPLSPGAEPAVGDMDLVAWNLSDFSLSYAGSVTGGEPDFAASSWTLTEETGLPLAVRVDLEMTNRQTRLRRRFFRIIWLPAGRRATGD